MAEAIPTAELEREAMTAPSDEALRSVGELAQRQVALEQACTENEEELKHTKDELRRVSEELLPAALKEHRMTGFIMEDGSSVTIKKIVAASIRKANRPEAFAWLREHGFGDLIKHKVTAMFGKGEEERATAAVDELARLGCDATDEESVHPQTLGAFVREQAEAGNAVPDDLLGVFRGEVSKIERAK